MSFRQQWEEGKFKKLSLLLTADLLSAAVFGGRSHQRGGKIGAHAFGCKCRFWFSQLLSAIATPASPLARVLDPLGAKKVRDVLP